MVAAVIANNHRLFCDSNYGIHRSARKVVLRLLDSDGNPLRMPNVLFAVKAFAKRKNDFDLGPFVTNDDGVVTI